MSLTQPKQINKFLMGSRRINTFSANTGSSDVTASITANLGTLPLQVYSATQQGVVTTTFNRVDIWDSATKEKIITNSSEVYGRLTEAAGVYTLTYYYNLAGVETAYTFGVATNIDFIYTYQYSFATLPSEFAIVLPESYVAQDIKNANGVFTVEVLPVTALNTITNLSFTPFNVNQVLLYVNGHQLKPTVDYTVLGVAITLVPATLGYDVDTTDSVQAVYFRQ